jgi:hypothetical protein
MTTEIRLLPVNSYELEQHLSDLGLSLLSFAKECSFSEKCVGVNDCDFIQSVIIEFTSELKIDFIAYHAVYKATSAGVERATVVANEHEQEVIAETAIHAHQSGIITDNFNPGAIFKFRYLLSGVKKNAINILYKKKVKRRQKQTKVDTIPQAVPGQFKVLMSTFYPNTVFTLTPIQDRLNEKMSIHQLYIANRYETFDRLISLGYKNIISAWGIGRTEKHIINTDVLKAFVNDYFDQSFLFGKATPHFKSIFYQLLKRKLQFAVSLYGPLSQVFNEYCPDCVVLSSSSPIDAQIIVGLASTRGIKTIEVTHGIFQDTPILKFQNIPVKLVWNQFQADLIKRFKESVNCILVGNPKHDMLLEKFKLHPPPNHFNQPYVLFATTPGNNISISQTTYLNILRDFVAAASENSEMLFVVKLHHGESKLKVMEQCASMKPPKNLVIEQSKDIYELIYHAKIVMVVTSTVGYEALLFNKKIISYTVQNSEKWLPFSKFNLAIAVNSAQGILNAIDELESSKYDSSSNEKKSYFVYSDGKAIDKTIDIILSR